MTDYINILGTEDPEYYAEIFCKISRPTDLPLLSDERQCPDVPGIQNIDPPLTQRLRILLDTIADISQYEQGNVCATMASLKDAKGALETRLYIAFNHHDDEAARCCCQHLESIFNMLHQVPYEPPAIDGTPKFIVDKLQNNFIEFSCAIHNYLFDIFAYRVDKHKDKLSEIRGYIEQDGTYFTADQRSKLLDFLLDVARIIKYVDKVKTTKQLSTNFLNALLATYSYWMKHDLLPEDLLAHNTFTILNHADIWLADVHGIGFHLARYALKIMSILISANRLFALTQSHRLRKIIQGKFSVEVLPSPTTAPYRCDLSRQAVQGALDAALAKTENTSADWVEQCESFVKCLLQKPVDHLKPKVHAELAMIMAMDKSEIRDVFPYIGISKLSCLMCSHYIHTFNKVTRKRIATKGSHGKAYPGWFWPALPSHDGELCPAFLGQMREQLLSDFMQYTESDSSVGSGAPRFNKVTRDEMDELYRKLLNSYN